MEDKEQANSSKFLCLLSSENFLISQTPPKTLSPLHFHNKIFLQSNPKSIYTILYKQRKPLSLHPNKI